VKSLFSFSTHLAELIDLVQFKKHFKASMQLLITVSLIVPKFIFAFMTDVIVFKWFLQGFSKSAPAFRALSSIQTSEDDNQQRFAKSASFFVKQDDSSPSMVFTERFKVSENGRLSILQLKNLALIDSISQRELMYQQECYRAYKERLKQLQREKLREKIRSFLNTIEHI